MAKQKRRSHRVRSQVEVRVREAGAKRSYPGVTRDVSEHGLFILTRQPFAPGTPVEIELLDRDHAATLDGVVVHASEMPAHLQGLQDSGIGVKILRPELPDLDTTGTARHSRRISPDAEATVFFGSERSHLTLHDLSTTGAALLSDRPLPDISFVRLHLKLTRDSDLLELDGVPVRAQSLPDGRYLFAIRFLDAPPAALTRIAAFVARRSTSPPDGGEEE